jgi:L-cystine transport system permease protein
MQFSIEFLWTAMREAFRFTPITLLMAFVPLLVGLALGTLIAIARVFKIRLAARFFQGTTVIFKGIPAVLLILASYFIFVQGFDVVAESLRWGIRAKDISPVYVAIFALSILSTVNISEAVRGALLSIEKGQYEAAYSVGLTRPQTLKRIVLPQAVPVAVPMLCNCFIGLIKASSLVFLISVTDILNGALISATGNYRYLEAYIAAALVYWALCIIVERLSFYLEKRLGRYRKELCS